MPKPILTPFLRRFLPLLALLACISLSPAQPKEGFYADLCDSREPSRKIVYREVKKQRLHLHVFEPEGFRASDTRAAFVVVHGGGWSHGDPHEAYPYAFHLAERGLVGVSVEYRRYDPAKGVQVQDAVEDVRAAVRYLKSHAHELGIDPNKIVVAGMSAGGHLAAGTALFDGIDAKGDDLAVSPKPAALVLLSAVVITEPNSKLAYKECAQRIGEKGWERLCPTERAAAGAPPTLLLHGKKDDVTPLAGATRFQRAMKGKGNVCELVTRPGGHDHVHATGAAFLESLRLIEAFLAAQKVATFPAAQAADPQAKHWALGTLVEGWREGTKPGDVGMAGHVVRNDARYLAVLFTERWTHEGKPVAPRVLWVWERRSKAGEALELVNVEQRHIGGGTKRFEIRGDVVLRKDKLSGTYEHGWQVGDGDLNHSNGPRTVLFTAAR